MTAPRPLRRSVWPRLAASMPLSTLTAAGLLGLCLSLATPALAHALPGAVPEVVQTALSTAGEDRDAAIAMLADQKDTVRPSQRVLVLLHLAEQRRLAKQRDRARMGFVEVLGLSRAEPLNASAAMGLALLDAEVALDSETLTTLVTTSDRTVLDSQNADRYLTLARRAATGGGGDFDTHAAHALDYSKDDAAHHQTIAEQLERLRSPERVASLPGGSDTMSSDDPLQRAREAFDRGDKGLARDLARAVSDTSEASTTRDAAIALVELIDAAPADSTKICALLPTGGKYAGVGRQVTDALRFGWGKVGTSARLTIADSGANATSAVAAFKDLVLKQGCLAVVGPLLSDEVGPVAAAAERYGVPLISLSQGLDDASDMAWVFQAAVTPRQQIGAMLDHLVYQDKKTFAVFAPDNDYGTHAASTFEEEAKRRGATVSVSVLYDPAASNLSKYAKKLGRKDYDSRSSEFRRLKDRAVAEGNDPSKVVLPPRLDFDALFLPEKASKVPLVASALAYEEFPVGEFRGMGSKRVPLLGLSGWNQSSLVVAGGGYVRTGLFTDVFVPPPAESSLTWHRTNTWERFVDDFRSKFDRNPRSLEAVAADAGLVVALATQSKPATRDAFRASLLSARPPGSVTGVRGFDADTHELQRDIRILSVRRDGFAPIAGD